MIKLKSFLFLGILVVIAVLVCVQRSSAGANKFDGIVPFASSAGFFGFFNQNDGKVYFYSGDTKECSRVLRLDELGKPLVQEK